MLESLRMMLPCLASIPYRDNVTVQYCTFPKRSPSLTLLLLTKVSVLESVTGITRTIVNIKKIM